MWIRPHNDARWHLLSQRDSNSTACGLRATPNVIAELLAKGLPERTCFDCYKRHLQAAKDSLRERALEQFHQILRTNPELSPVDAMARLPKQWVQTIAETTPKFKNPRQTPSPNASRSTPTKRAKKPKPPYVWADLQWIQSINEKCEALLRRKRADTLTQINGLINITWDEFGRRSAFDKREAQRMGRFEEYTGLVRAARASFQKYIEVASLEVRTTNQKPRGLRGRNAPTLGTAPPRESAQQRLDAFLHPNAFIEERKRTAPLANWKRVEEQSAENELEVALRAAQRGMVELSTIVTLSAHPSQDTENYYVASAAKEWTDGQWRYVRRPKSLPAGVECTWADTPLGAAVLGQRIGDIVMVGIEDEARELRIIGVRAFQPVFTSPDDQHAAKRNDRMSTAKYVGRTRSDGTTSVSLDGGLYLGYLSREEGRYGSIPAYDDYGDESSPEGRDYGDFPSPPDEQ